MKQFIKKVVRKIDHSLLQVTYNYECPICGHKDRALEPIGVDIPVLLEKQVIGAGRRLGGCRKCHSSDRERLIYVHVVNEIGIEKGVGKKVLHIAPEQSLYKYFSTLKNIEYVCGDKFTEGYSYPGNVQDLDILGLPFETASFDLILCNHVLEHIEDDLTAIKELYRVLKPGGKAILQVPISGNTYQTVEDFSIQDPKQREVVFGQFDHVRIYGQDYKNRLESGGFKVSRISIAKDTSYKKYGLNEQEDIFEGMK